MAETAQDEIQPLSLIKRMLGMAEKDAYPCAFALTKDKKECVLLIEKNGSAKKVATTLKTDGKAFVDPVTLRFGNVKIDVPTDPGTVKFTVNKSEAGGTIMHMVTLVKKAGYQGLVINADTALENEPDEAAVTGAPPPPPPKTDAPIDAAALKARLTALVEKMKGVIAADPSRKDGLLAMAKRAQLMLGTNNLQSATQNIDELELALDAAGTDGLANGGANGTAKTADPAALAKSRQIWAATGQRVTAEVNKLRASLQTNYAEDASGPAIVAAFDKRIEPIMAIFDHELVGLLDAAATTKDAAERQEHSEKAKQVIGKYKTFIESDPLVGDLDDNPFVKLSIRTIMGTTLTALVSTVH